MRMPKVRPRNSSFTPRPTPAPPPRHLPPRHAPLRQLHLHLARGPVLGHPHPPEPFHHLAHREAMIEAEAREGGVVHPQTQLQITQGRGQLPRVEESPEVLGGGLLGGGPSARLSRHGSWPCRGPGFAACPRRPSSRTG